MAQGSATRWAADDRTLHLGLGILGVAMGAGSSSAASASAVGGATPRAATPLRATPGGASPTAADARLGQSPPGEGAHTPLWVGTPAWGSGSGKGFLQRLNGSGSVDGSLGSVLPGQPAM